MERSKVVQQNLVNSALFPIIYCFHRAKKEGTTQYGYRKWETRAQIFPPNTRTWEQQE